MKKKIFALGFFDGVHLGHQALLAACRDLAKEAVPAAVTFDLPPGAVLQQKNAHMLCTLADRKRLLQHCGAEKILVLNANAETLNTPWEVFLEKLLAQGGVGFVCGDDYRFGHRGEGTAEKLKAFCAARGLPCVIVPEQSIDGARISSTAIRTLLEQGKIEQANRLLGHPHILSGEVVQGKRLGRTLGFPTANLELPPELLVPRKGVYACRAYVDGGEYAAVTNIGTRPTVRGERVNAESHLLDFSGDLYGKFVTLAFHAFLRPEEKFDSLEALQAQIESDTENARKIFA